MFGAVGEPPVAIGAPEVAGTGAGASHAWFGASQTPDAT